jgi:protocatechuate 3,4-dioxygenase alpha subunit
MSGQTPSQTVGPYFSMILAHDDEGETLVADTTVGEPIVITGTLLDGDRAPIEDGLVEIWQANADGRYRHPLDDRHDVPVDDTFTGFGRAKTHFEDGTFRFRTIRPGAVPAPDGGMQAPHVNVVVQARGMLDPVWTRLYFPEDTDAHAGDPVLAAVPTERRDTLVAVPDGDEDGVSRYRFDIRFQGDDETVFLDF